MDVYAPGGDITVAFDMFDRSGAVIAPVSASWEVYDEDGELVTSGTVDPGDIGSTISVTVSAVSNALDADVHRGTRTVVLTVATASGNHGLTSSYIIERPFSALQIPGESAMTWGFARALALDIPNLDGWEGASDVDQKMALRDAWSRLSRMRFRPWREYEELPDRTGVSAPLLDGEFRLSELTSEQWDLLPGHFRSALRRAQLIEADEAISGNVVADNRMSGLMSKTVGESSEMYRPGKPMIAAIASRSMRELSGYIDRRMRIGRA